MGMFFNLINWVDITYAEIMGNSPDSLSDNVVLAKRKTKYSIFDVLFHLHNLIFLPFFLFFHWISTGIMTKKSGD